MTYSTNDFRIWVARMGFNQREITKAAREVGINNRTTVSETFQGRRELTLSERLAMTAVRAGLKPWTPEYDDELMAGRKEREPNAA